MTDASNAAITSQTDIANLQSFRYRGYYYDSNSGFYYLQSRYYDPVTHRFLNADGLVSTGTGVLGYNMFAYCENNPVNNSDYDGEKVYPSNFIGPLKPGDYRLPANKISSAVTVSIPVAIASTSKDTWSYKGWTYRIDNPRTGSEYEQTHIHIKNKNKEYIQNIDGTLHHKNKNSGDPPNSIKKKLKDDNIWD